MLSNGVQGESKQKLAFLTKLDGVASLVADPPGATPTLGNINPFELGYIGVIFEPIVKKRDVGYAYSIKHGDQKLGL